MYLYLDTETRSELDLEVVGAYKYASHPSTELLMCAYAFGEEEIKLWEPHKSPIPDELFNALCDPFQIIVAWNSQFDRLVFRNQLRLDIPVDRWIDPMVLSRYMSMPGAQEKVGNILDIKAKKLVEESPTGGSIIDYFCQPLMMGGTETLFGIEPAHYRDWDTNPKEWARLQERNIVDVEGMREIHKRLSNHPLPDFEWELFALNEKINDFGIYVDSKMIQGAMKIVDEEFKSLRKKFQDITGIAKPKSPRAVLAWARKHGYTFPSINKVFVKRALAGECPLDDKCKEALSLRMQLGKSSVAKLEAIRDAVESDGRVRGLFNFMGAARTGRWTSGLVQLQNLVKATKEVEKKYDLAIKLLRAGDYETIKKEFTNPIDVACASIRLVFRAPVYKKFIIADLSAIETRGSAWVAGCDTLMDIFRKGLDPYIVFAALMAGKTYEEIAAIAKLDKKIRNDAKPPMLGCGYGLTPGDISRDEEGNIVKTGLLGYASSMQIELEPEYAEKAVEVYRQSYPEIPAFWWDLDRAFVQAVETEEPQEIGPLTIERKGRVVCLWLPSGRALHYVNPQTEEVERISKRTGKPYKATSITIEGVDQKTHSWTRINTYGPKLFENVVQAICRDILAHGMIEADKAGFPIVLTCHDEIVAEVPEDSPLTVKDLEDIMCIIPNWAPGFLIGAAGFETIHYRKD